MKLNKLTQRPFLLFLPFLIIFAIWVIFYPTTFNEGDELRYLRFAHNLLHGFYSTPYPDIDLMNGPGYPLLLVPFLAFKLPLICITLANVIFHYLSIVFLFKALQKIVPLQVTLVFSLFWACYYIAYQTMPMIYTEPFTYFLISLLILCVVNVFSSSKSKFPWKQLILTGMVFGLIVLTKIIFAYVLMICLVGSGILFLFNRKSVNYKKGFIVLTVAFIFTIPYLAYTYNLSGKLFYWASGGDSLYWMSTPYADEYGDWTDDLSQHSVRTGNYDIPGAGDTLRMRHEKQIEKINEYKGTSRDSAYKSIAIINIKSHPLKFAQNCIYNISRMLFHYPFSYAVQRPKSFLIFPLNGILLTLILFSFIPTFLNWKRTLYSVRFIFVLALLYFGLSTVVSALPRMFTVIVPIIVVWIAYTFSEYVRISFKK